MTKIKSDSYKLRLATENDAELVWRWRNHPNIREYMFNQSEIELVEHKKWFSTQLKKLDKVFLIYLYNNIEQGFVNFNQLKSDGVWEWGFYVSPDSPKGIGRYMGELSIQYAFDIMCAEKLFAEILEYNQRSIKFHENLGFSKEGCLRKHFLLNGKFHDVQLFGLLKKEHARN
ncbi:UDP-4-amino-4,6-dideoxy-N-acetyl-beta-L-altrosamine N-acetyltransferase [Pectobacterium parmentieri]|uniref:Pseudaminic acid biosynthesis N-acetyl transferase n=1 Tax=Pectobacterium parmentieri TaxID=1905730 RepID=A0A0H3I4Y4_PECPM|nr:UDP-4-amino-4,6-dideoxy-N-acetyl-beta-L-altrosamine N-acetyltransferase [Pectobacterium parmentieri]ACX88773.1 pseudaminic acid biosynthesis N-acetyl transferase [Pectobacterium parmentieri WPP163]AFI91099.1 Pseudaminic acid biosynthesis N-acetyl transferase [Pectobacterium parmentieri]AYH32759.1 UDP-4-amino-4,6-dideoxy-N-acetyl-beta-L-altrosamine N-acetyltransferase [Pectobacterium parmentieri]MCL6355539.1 UDP-4-amino-4,6-dideoxy-N-acetyl-beta-L-altrosamine N-acetyltransferase [Pectobacteri